MASRSFSADILSASEEKFKSHHPGETYMIFKAAPIHYPPPFHKTGTRHIGNSGPIRISFTLDGERLRLLRVPLIGSIQIQEPGVSRKE